MWLKLRGTREIKRNLRSLIYKFAKCWEIMDILLDSPFLVSDGWSHILLSHLEWGEKILKLFGRNVNMTTGWDRLRKEWTASGWNNIYFTCRIGNTSQDGIARDYMGKLHHMLSKQIEMKGNKLKLLPYLYL